MNYIIENENSKYKKEIETIINNRKKEIFDFFNSTEIDLPCNVYLYESQESLVDRLKKRGFSKDPDYMCACFKDEDNSLNFFEPKDNPGDKEWSKEEYKDVIFHELIHAIEFNLFGPAPEWLCEGIAKYLDGTYSKGIKHLLDNYINNNQIPNQREIEEEFGMHEYNSYDYAYLMVSYLIDTLGKDKFIEVLKENKIDKYKDDLLNKTIDFYNIKLVPLKEIINKELYEMYKDFPKDEIGSTNDYYGLSYDDFLIKCNEKVNEENEINVDINTTTKVFILVNNDKLIGEVGIRTTLNEFWINRGSQIYYKIRLSERNKGYGNIILKLALIEAKKLGFNQIRINCDDNNIQSKKVILNNDGILDIKSYKTIDGTSSSYIIKI